MGIDELMEAISFTHYMSELKRQFITATREPLYHKRIYRQEGNELHARGFNRSISVGTHVDDDSYLNWFVFATVDVLSLYLNDRLPSIASQIADKSIKFSFDHLTKNENGHMTSSYNGYRIAVNDALITELLVKICDELPGQLAQAGAVEDDKISDMTRYCDFLKSHSLYDIVVSVGLNHELDDAMDAVVSTLLHELVHVRQQVASKLDEPKYTSYLHKGSMFNVPDDDPEYMRKYMASPQEIAAHAHGGAARMLSLIDSKWDKAKNKKDLLVYFLRQLDSLVNGKLTGIEVIDFYIENFNHPGKIEYKIFKRFLKLLYGELTPAIARYKQDVENEKMKINELLNKIDETATAGATSSANIGTVVNPQISPGKSRGKKSYTGTPGHSGTKSPEQPTISQPKTTSGTAVNALDMKGANLFGGGAVKR